MATILIVDDNLETCQMLCGLLNAAAHRVSYVSGSRDALAALEREIPDLFLIDMMMPTMDGMKLLAALREDPRTARAAVIMFSAVPSDDFRDEALRKGANDFWRKGSFDFADLKRRVQALLPP